MYSDLLHVCGIDRLMETMISLLTSKMILEIPRLIETMKVKRDKVSLRLKEPLYSNTSPSCGVTLYLVTPDTLKQFEHNEHHNWPEFRNKL